MNSLFRKLLAPHQMEYVTANRSLIIVEATYGVQRFADAPEEVSIGKDIRLGFPELIGVEDILIAILNGEQASFEIKGICRSSHKNNPLYLDIYVSEYLEEQNLEHRIILLFEDVTETMVMRQNLVQRANEASLLFNALAASKDYINKIVTSMADALLVTNQAGQIKKINSAAEVLFGYQEHELLNQSISTIVLDQSKINAAKQECLINSNSLVRDLEITCKKKNNTEIMVEFSCAAIQTEVEGVQEFVFVGRDVTLRKQQEAEIRQSLEQEKELRQLKSHFFAMISHELGSPINTVLFSIELLKKYSERTDETKRKNYLDHIETATKHMKHLLEDLRFISSIETGKFSFNPAPLDLEKFCQSLIEEVQILAGKNHQIILNKNILKPGKINPDYLRQKFPNLDEKLLWHILMNLLSNAVKYSPQGSPISLKVIWQGNEAIFEVKDKGIGIPASDCEHLFELFYRAKNVGKIPGTGLGLAVVKQSVDLHGGTISVESEVGVGTTFKVLIPIQSNYSINVAN